jgi:serine/threonine protein kinase
MSLAAGTRLGPYEITSRIGAGGVGEVYLAHDERLDRDVALKVLAAAVADDPASASRLRREARALSRLNHPNIAAVYDFDMRDGITFIAMEYVSGLAVGDMAGQGALAEDRVLDLALQLADGLVAAHREAEARPRGQPE